MTKPMTKGKGKKTLSERIEVLEERQDLLIKSLGIMSKMVDSLAKALGHLLNMKSETG